MTQRRWKLIAGLILVVMLGSIGLAAAAAEMNNKEDPLVNLSYIENVLAPEAQEKMIETIDAKLMDFYEERDAEYEQTIADLKERVGTLEGLYAALPDNPELIAAIAEGVSGGGTTTEPVDTPATSTGAVDTFKVVTIQAGKTVTCQVGVEVLVRFGTATCVAQSSPGLINETTGTVLENGGVLSANNLYLVTIKDRQIKAPADSTVTVLIRGEYSIN